jgi:putative tryptophan/tyrosine transport system substrate-binding protein
MKTPRPIFTSILTVALLIAPLPVHAQPAGKVYRVGVLETIPLALNAANFDAFRHGLRALGYIEGQNLVIEYRSADGDASRFPALATELVRLQVDVLVTRGTPAALAAKNAAGSIPVVMAAIGDPSALGIVANLARPGGNITGLNAFATELSGKRIELLREILPRIKRIAALLNMGNPLFPPQWKEIETAARSLGIKPQLLDVRKSEELGPLFDAAITSRADALVVGADGVAQANLQSITELATKHRLPTMYPSREFVDAGGLISYGVSYPHLYYRASAFVDKIFRGAKPGDLPVEQPTKFELVINMKAAKALGLTITPSVLARTDEIIQ